MVSERMKVGMDEGKEEEFGSSDALVVQSGHNAWVIGNESVVAVDFTGWHILSRLCQQTIVVVISGGVRPFLIFLVYLIKIQFSILHLLCQVNQSHAYKFESNSMDIVYE